MVYNYYKPSYNIVAISSLFTRIFADEAGREFACPSLDEGKNQYAVS